MLSAGGGASRADLRRWGIERPVIDRMLRKGEIARCGRGCYVLTFLPEANESWQVRRSAHLFRTAAMAGTGRVTGRRSAALAWQLPVAEMPHQVELIRPQGSSGVEGALVLRRDLPPRHITAINGVPVTTMARTAVDIALGLPVPQALVTVDAVLRRGVSRSELHDMLREFGSGPGVREARRILEWADGHAESALESRGRGEMLVRGVPRPLCNVSIRFEGVEFRVDDWWEGIAVAAEADGAQKYDEKGLVVRPRTLWEEKLRQDWLVERLDIPVLRYVDREVRYDADGLVRRLNRKLERRLALPWTPPPGVEVFQRPLPGSDVPIRWLLGGPHPSM